tara:strand:- start:153 stop:1166 length:1014 start_codon:yes stop_codon:yes gene_type:complete
MGSVIKLSKKINNSYLELKKSVEDRLIMVDEKIEQKLQSNVELVKKMSSYHLETGGKKLRALITLGASKLCGYTKGSRDVNFAACVELIHSATLMHDDVIDNGELRRGKKTLNKIWGNQSSILVGDYLLSRCFEMMVEDGNLEILKLLSSTSALISQGEILQLQYKGDVDMLEETYLKIISNKTASLFLAAAKIGSLITNKENKYKDALESYGKNLGLTFQIADDTLDYNSDIKQFGKNVGNDFFEGKVTLPIILLFQKLNISEKKILKDIFAKDVRSNDDLNFVLNLIRNKNTINECHKKAEYFINLASNSLNIFENSEEKNILNNLTTFSLERNF